MGGIPSPVDRLLGGSSFLPRVDRQDGRAIDDALNSATLFDEGIPLNGAMVEGAYAAKDPPIVRWLARQHIPYLMDLQSLRFAGDGFLAVQEMVDLPYAPRSPIAPAQFDEKAAKTFVSECMEFTQLALAAAYTSPGLPLADSLLEASITANRRIIEATCASNGVGELDRRPVLALVAPGRKAMAAPELVLDWLVDLPVSGVYFQPVNFNPITDSAEKLANYIQYVRAFREAGLRVVCGRVGAFGLLLQALLGVAAFDSGLGTAEAFTLSTQLRKPKQHADGSKPSSGGDKRIYFGSLKTTLQSKHALPLLDEGSVRHRLACSLGCCRFRGFEDLASRRRSHYLFTRSDEVRTIADRPHTMRMAMVQEQLTTARENARVVRRTLMSKGIEPPAFEHLDRWLGLLTRGDQLSLKL